MSEVDSSENDSNSSEKQSIKFDENFVITLTIENAKIIDRNAKQNCRVLLILSELDIDQKLTIISTLEPSENPNLFIFIIEHQNGNLLTEKQITKTQQLNEHFCKFGAARPLIILQRFVEENETKFYYKEENSTQIVDIDQHYAEDLELHDLWQNILSTSDKDLQQLQDELLKKLSCIKNSSIMLRLLRTFNLPEEFFETIVRFIAAKGSKAELLAVLNASFEDNGRILNEQAQNYIKNVLEDDESESESSEASDEYQMEVETASEELSVDVQDDPIDETSLQFEKTDSSQSVLLTAVEYSNQEIIDYLVTYWTPLIQQLPIDHLITISTAAFDSNQLDVLTDLLEFSDFPFPNDFNVTKNQIDHKRLQKIITDRIKFHEVIEQENYKEIKNFIDNNLSLKFIYSPKNVTAMKKAIDSQKYKIYYYLKSFGLCASEFNNIDEVLNEKELIKANDQAYIQKTESISDALRHESKSVLILCTRALIHNRKVKKEDETKYRKHIKKWLEDVNKKADIMLDVAASCENLVIVFDFESKYVDRTAFMDNALGLSSDTVSSRIFIGSKLGDSKRDQEIKGVLAHELCHYVMSLVYENKFLPYYKYAKDIRDIFDGIVKTIDKWSANDPKPPDDECNGIISTVFTSYPVNCFHFELIVRAVHILVLYDNNLEHSACLQQIYQYLFEFWYNQVIPELHKYLQKNKVVIRINATVELLSSLSKSKIEFKGSKNMEQLTKNRIIIVATNVPKLLLIDINKHLQQKYGCFLESQNIFLEPEKIKNEQVWKDLMHIYTKDVKLNIFVDCTKGYLENLNRILRIDEFNLILVTSNEEQSAKMNDICINKKITPNFIVINYNWGDLTEESQHKLLQTKIAFQNNSEIILMELLSKTTNPNQNEVDKLVDDFSNTINDQVFNQIIEKQEISVNLNLNDWTNNFSKLFQNRIFLKKGINFKNEISQEKLISITANNKHVLISDIAGSGKSWVVKNISKLIMKQDPTRWVTYVDLKQFIEEFNKQTENCKFENYFVENILKPKTEFEEKIFKKLYKNGKVSIIFDGFDEIAPDCAEFVADLAELFKFNDGNQLWIVTRDYFEVNLQHKLDITNTYKLDEFTEKDGINFIVSSWILMDSKDKAIKDFEKCLQNSPNLKKYQEKAKGIVRKVTMSKNQSIGLPQLFSMIADGFKDDKFVLDDLKGAKIFTKFVQIMYTRWLKNGQLREDANALSLDYEMNFKEFHQFFAILGLFPELVDSLFPDYDISEWPETEIIAGGLLNKIGLSFSFIHEIFREYFVADFIFKAVRKPKVKEEIFNLLIKVLTIQKYGIIRMFLNDFIDNSSMMEKVQLELEKSIEKFNNMENLSDYFTENQEHLAKLVIKILKKGDYENVKKILTDNFSAVASSTKGLKMFSAFTEFLFSYLENQDLKDMINEQNILHKIIGSDSDAEFIEYFLLKLEEKVGREFIQQQLKLMSSEYEDENIYYHENGNIFHHLGTSQNLCKEKVQKCFEIFQKYLDDNEIVELMDNCNQYRQMILMILMNNASNFKQFLDGAESFFTNKDLIQKFKIIISKTNFSGVNILHWSVYADNIDLHTSLWKLIQKIFEDQEELTQFVLQKNDTEDNFLHFQFVQNNKPETIEIVLQKLKENLSEQLYHKILRSKGEFGRNLLQVAAWYSKEVKTHEILWKKLQDSCKSNAEFMDIIRHHDDSGSDVFNIAAAFTTAEVFEFMEEKLAKIASRDVIRKLFIKLRHGNRNLLQTAAIDNKSLELHKTLWKIIRKYFSATEILNIIKNLEINSQNLLVIAANCNTKEILELTWTEVENILTDLYTDQETIQKIEQCEIIIQKIVKTKVNKTDKKENNDEDLEFLNLEWIKIPNSGSSNLFDEDVLRNNITFETVEDLMSIVLNKSVSYHQLFWEHLLKTFEKRQDLAKVLHEKKQNDSNLIYLIVMLNTAEIIEFTLNKLKENLNTSDYHEMLRSKGYLGRNLLQAAAAKSKEIIAHQILWKELQDTCNSDVEFLEVIGEFDEDGCNVFHLAAAITTAEVFKFLENELTKIASRDEIRKLFIKLVISGRNALQSAAIQNKSLDLHETLWEIIEKYFSSCEIIQFVKHRDAYACNLIMHVINGSTKEIKELTWNKVRKVLITIGYEDNDNFKDCDEIMKKDINFYNSTVEVEEILKLDWIDSTNNVKLLNDNIQLVMQKEISVISLEDLLPFIADKNVGNHDRLWIFLEECLKSNEDMKKLLLEKDPNGNNFIRQLLIFNTTDVIEFALNKLKGIFSESDYQEILRSKGKFGRNLLQAAATNSKGVKIHQILWKAFRDSCKSDEEFLELLAEGDNNGENVFHIAATFSTKDIFNFMLNELDKFAPHDKIKKLLINLGLKKRNLLQAAAEQNESLELHEALWEIIEKYFESSEIFQFIKHCDVYGNNVLIDAIKNNTNEVKELILNKVEKILKTIECEDNAKFKEYINFDKLTEGEQKDKILKLDFIDCKNSVKLFEDNTELVIKKEIADISLEDLMLLMTDENVENHSHLWKYLEENFKSYEDLKKLLFEKTPSGDSFIHLLVILNTTDVVEFTLQKLKENLNESDYFEVLKSKGQIGRNLLQYAANSSKKVKTYQILWKELKNTCESYKEFLEILGEIDEHGGDVLHLAAAITTGENFEFIEKELTKIASRDEIRKLFIKLGLGNHNLLQAAAGQNESVELHKTLWEILQKYFNSSEIMEFVKNRDFFGENLLIKVIEKNTKEVAELTWKEVNELLNSNDLISEEHKENIQKCEKIIKSISGPYELKRNESEILKLKWVKNKNSEAAKLFKEVIQRSVQQLNLIKLEYLQFFIEDENVKNHEKLWENLAKIYKTREDWKNILLDKDDNDNNFIHQLVIQNTTDVIEFTLDKLKKNLNETDYQRILRSNGYLGRNLLQLAAICSKEVKIHEILWEELQDTCNSDDEFLEVIGQVDEKGCNVFSLAATFTTAEVFKFLEKELTKIASRDEIRNLFIKLGVGNRNLLQAAAGQNKSLLLHKTLWTIIQKYFNSAEILEFIKNCDVCGNNLLITVIDDNSKEVAELTWKGVKRVLNTNDLITEELKEKVQKCEEILTSTSGPFEVEEREMLKLKWITNKNSEASKLFDEEIQLLVEQNLNNIKFENLRFFMADENMKHHEKLWKSLAKIYKTREDLKKLLFEKDENGNNFIHLIFTYNTADVIEFTLNKFEENLNESDYQEILRSKGQFGRNLLQPAAKENRIHEILWEELRDTFKSDDEFLEFFEEANDAGNDVFNVEDTFSNNKIFEFKESELD